MALFSDDDVAVKQPFRVKFVGEKGIDTGGLSREAFSTFWELAYQKHFDGTCLLTPLMCGGIDNNVLQVLGRILSFGCGFLPMRVAFPSLLSVLLGPQPSVSCEVLIATFKDCLNPVDIVTLNEAFACRAGVFPQALANRLIALFSRFDSLEVPKPATLLRLCEQSARYLFITKPYAALSEMAKGVPVQHQRFWKKMGADGLYRLYVSLAISSLKVIDSIEEPLVVSPSEQKVFNYLVQFVGCLKVDELQKFLRFCTGSSVCFGKPITLAFNSQTGMARRPIAHVCDCVLELSRVYSSYPDFSREFAAILASEDNGWLIDGI